MNCITYCMNVHQGETLETILAALEDVTIPLRNVLEPNAVFPVGLRLGAATAKTLRQPETLKRLQNFLCHNKLSVIGINGFPYGTFHGESIKEDVYLPDWTDARRIGYTQDLFYTLLQLPIAQMGTYYPNVTTVPIGYKHSEGMPETIFDTLCAMALFLRKLEGFTGKRMCLAIEPEPDCLLETTQEVIDFFERLWQSPGWSPAFRNYIGLCFDTCHFAVNYEDPLKSLQRIVAAKIPVVRIQVSAALAFHTTTPIEVLRPFVDREYLHQTRVVNETGEIERIADMTDEVLPQLIGKEGRIHYHVPLAWEGTAVLKSTRETLTPAFWRYVRSGGWPLEIETYTYFVYPQALRCKTLSKWLLDDFVWVKEQLKKV